MLSAPPDHEVNSIVVASRTRWQRGCQENCDISARSGNTAPIEGSLTITIAWIKRINYEECQTSIKYWSRIGRLMQAGMAA